MSVLEVNLVTLFDKMVRYAKKVKNHWPILKRTIHQRVQRRKYKSQRFPVTVVHVMLLNKKNLLTNEFSTGLQTNLSSFTIHFHENFDQQQRALVNLLRQQSPNEISQIHNGNGVPQPNAAATDTRMLFRLSVTGLWLRWLLYLLSTTVTNISY